MLPLILLLLLPLLLPINAQSDGDTTTISCTVRDFGAADFTNLDGGVQEGPPHPDFGLKSGSDTRVVTSNLGSDDKPVYAGNPSTPSTTDATRFNQWYNTDTRTTGDGECGATEVCPINLELQYDLTLTYQSSTNKWGYDSATENNMRGGNQGFFILDYLGFQPSSSAKPHNYHFTMECAMEFTYHSGDTFDFTGDDDVWVYINRKKAIDLGGVHGPATGTLNLDSQSSQLGISTNGKYSMHLFFAERRAGGSNFKMETTLSLVGSCGPGTYQDSNALDPNECRNCPAGYSFVNVESLCDICAPGKYQDQNAAASVSCKFCAAGFAFASTTTACTECVNGEYQTANTLTSASCLTCAAGQYTSAKENACGACETGKFQELAQSIEYTCKFCAAGKKFATKTTACVNCINGQYQDQNTLAGASCLTCAAGQFSAAKETTCALCVDGKFQDLSAATGYTCKTCGKGQYAESASVSCKDCTGVVTAYTCNNPHELAGNDNDSPSPTSFVGDNGGKQHEECTMWGPLCWWWWILTLLLLIFCCCCFVLLLCKRKRDGRQLLEAKKSMPFTNELETDKKDSGNSSNNLKYGIAVANNIEMTDISTSNPGFDQSQRSIHEKGGDLEIGVVISSSKSSVDTPTVAMIDQSIVEDGGGGSDGVSDGVSGDAGGEGLGGGSERGGGDHGSSISWRAYLNNLE